MKKITKLIAALAVFASVLMLSGCAFDWTQTYDTWYKYDKKNGVNIFLGETDETENDVTGGQFKNAEFYVKFNPDNGLTVRFLSTQSQEVSYLGGTFTTTASITTGGEKTYEPKEFGKIKWIALINTGYFVEKTPKELDVELTSLFKGGIQWKKVLAQILFNQLLGE